MRDIGVFTSKSLRTEELVEFVRSWSARVGQPCDKRTNESVVGDMPDLLYVHDGTAVTNGYFSEEEKNAIESKLGSTPEGYVSIHFKSDGASALANELAHEISRMWEGIIDYGGWGGGLGVPPVMETNQVQPSEHRDITFADTVRVKATPETEAAGLAGLTGEVVGQSVPSISGASPIIGSLTEDYAVNVFFADRNEGHWFAEQLLEFVAHTPGAELRLDGVAGQWVRDADGKWELPADGPDAPEARPGLFGRLLKRITG
jgi:hypothetical protein